MHQKIGKITCTDSSHLQMLAWRGRRVGSWKAGNAKGGVGRGEGSGKGVENGRGAKREKKRSGKRVVNGKGSTHTFM